jgi:CubicO group peptidase (beta-lactamase class C family)
VSLPTSAPESQGIPSAAILDFLAAAEERIDALHSMVLVRHGHTVAQGWWSPYRAEEPHMLFSLSKSFTSTGIGLAVAEGLLSIDDPVVGFFPEHAPVASRGDLTAMRVRHLLTMTTGHHAATAEGLLAERDWVEAFLAAPVSHEPGTEFCYEDAASFMLSAIIQRRTGTTLLDYLRPRLLEPLGITGATWEAAPRGISAGGWGLNLRTPDVARFGQLYLQQGRWDGRQLVPREWVAEATGYQVSNERPGANPDWAQGYGFQFWRCRHGAYRGDGAFGQFCLVLPEQDAVLVTTAGLADPQGVLDLVWTHLLPAMGPSPLPAQIAAQERLAERLAGLRLPPVPGMPSSPVAAQVSERKYLTGAETGLAWLRIDAGREHDTLTLHHDWGTHELVAGHGEWRTGNILLPNHRDQGPHPVAVSGAWVDERTYVVRSYLLRTPFLRTLTLRFDGDGLTLDARENVAFGPTEHPRVTAVAA